MHFLLFLYILFYNKQKIGKYPHTSRLKKSKNDLNQFINLTQRQR